MELKRASGAFHVVVTFASIRVKFVWRKKVQLDVVGQKCPGLNLNVTRGARDTSVLSIRY